MKEMLTAAQWQAYEEEGYALLGKVVSDDELAALIRRIDDIMLGRANVDYDRLMMQREAGEGYPQSEQTLGFKGVTLNYRKIENLEFDALFLTYLQKPLFRHICDTVYGANKRIGCFRAMFMNKPAYHGSVLVYHQDRWFDLNRDPLITVWIALDRATRDNGCVQIFPGTHRHIINPGHPDAFLTPEQRDRLLQTQVPVALELEPGEAVLLHNWTVHGSDGNSTGNPRKAFSVCYMDEDTVSTSGIRFSQVFGPGALQPPSDSSFAVK